MRTASRIVGCCLGLGCASGPGVELPLTSPELSPMVPVEVDVLEFTPGDTDVAQPSDTDIGPLREPPSTPLVTIQPPFPTSGDDLYVEIDAGPHTDDLVYEIKWLVNGEVWDVNVDAVPADLTERDDTWLVEVVASNGHTVSAPGAATTTILNAPPVVFGVGIEPSLPRADNDLNAQFACADLDGDETAASVQWMRNGTVMVIEGDGTRVPSQLTAQGDVWQLRVWCHDGADRSLNTLSAYITIL